MDCCGVDMVMSVGLMNRQPWTWGRQRRKDVTAKYAESKRTVDYSKEREKDCLYLDRFLWGRANKDGYCNRGWLVRNDRAAVVFIV